MNILLSFFFFFFKYQSDGQIWTTFNIANVLNADGFLGGRSTQRKWANRMVNLKPSLWRFMFIKRKCWGFRGPCNRGGRTGLERGVSQRAVQLTPVLEPPGDACPSQIRRPHPRPTETEFWGCGTRESVLNEHPSWGVRLKLGTHVYRNVAGTTKGRGWLCFYNMPFEGFLDLDCSVYWHLWAEQNKKPPSILNIPWRIKWRSLSI